MMSFEQTLSQTLTLTLALLSLACCVFPGPLPPGLHGRADGGKQSRLALWKPPRLELELHPFNSVCGAFVR